MSTLPLLLTLAEGLDSLNDDYYSSPRRYYHPRQYHHHHHPSLRLIIPSFNALQKDKSEDKGAVSAVGKDGFQVCMDVQQFKPSELTVKTVDNSVVVEGKHEERPDEHGFISRHFVRRYILPDGYDPKQVVSTLSSDGVLTIKVPAPQKTETNERIVHIQQTGPAHLSVKENTKEEKEEEK